MAFSGSLTLLALAPEAGRQVVLDMTDVKLRHPLQLRICEMTMVL